MIDAPLPIQLRDRFVKRNIDRGDIVESLMSQMVALHVAPAEFDVVEFRCIPRPPLGDNPVSRREPGFHLGLSERGRVRTPV
jgi:hypothetical protein